MPSIRPAQFQGGKSTSHSLECIQAEMPPMVSTIPSGEVRINSPTVGRVALVSDVDMMTMMRMNNDGEGNVDKISTCGNGNPGL